MFSNFHNTPVSISDFMFSSDRKPFLYILEPQCLSQVGSCLWKTKLEASRLNEFTGQILEYKAWGLLQSWFVNFRLWKYHLEVQKLFNKAKLQFLFLSVEILRNSFWKKIENVTEKTGKNPVCATNLRYTYQLLEFVFKTKIKILIKTDILYCPEFIWSFNIKILISACTLHPAQHKTHVPKLATCCSWLFPFWWAIYFT